MLMSCFIATVVAVLVTIHPARCKLPIEDFQDVCAELQKPSTNDNHVKYADDTAISDIHDHELEVLALKSTPREIASKIRNRILEWDQELKNTRQCDKASRFSLAKLCSSKSKRQQSELETALTYAYYQSALNYEYSGQLIAAMIQLNHLKTLRMKYKGVPVSKILLLERSIRTSIKYSCDGNMINRLLGIAEQPDEDNIEDVYRRLKDSFYSSSPIDSRATEDEMKLVRRLTDLAYQLKKEGISEKEIGEEPYDRIREYKSEKVDQLDEDPPKDMSPAEMTKELNGFQERLNIELQMVFSKQYENCVSYLTFVVADISRSIANHKKLPETDERKSHLDKLMRMRQEAQLKKVFALKEQSKYDQALYELEHLKSLEGFEPNETTEYLEKHIRDLRRQAFH